MPALPSRRAGWESERGWGVPLGAAPSQSASLLGWAGRERERRERERERVGDDIDTLPRSEASGRADTNLAAKRQLWAILAGTERARGRPRRLSWDFFSTTTLAHRGPLKVSQSVGFEAPRRRRRVLERMKRTGQTASGVASKTDVNCCEGSVE